MMMKLKRAFALVLCVLTLFSLSACAKNKKEWTPAEFLSNINRLSAEDFGVLVVKESIDTYTQSIEITEHLRLLLISDTVTGTLYRAQLVLTLNTETEKLDYSAFSYFFLIMLKAYNEDISVAEINAIHDALGIETYESGTDAKIGYGSTSYFYQVTAEEAVFEAQYSTPSAKDMQPY